jgi:hypothetical protein
LSYLHPIAPLACFYSAMLAWNLSAVDTAHKTVNFWGKNSEFSKHNSEF